MEVKEEVRTDLVLDAMAEAVQRRVRMKMTMILKRKRSTMIGQERRKEEYPTSLSMKQVGRKCLVQSNVVVSCSVATSYY